MAEWQNGKTAMADGHQRQPCWFIWSLTGLPEVGQEWRGI